MVLGFGLFIAAALLLRSGITGQSLAEIVRGEPGDGNNGLFGGIDTAIPKGGGGGGGKVSGLGGSVGATAASGTPKNVVDTMVIPIARKNGIPISVKSNDAANAGRVGGTTTSGNASDHGGPPGEKWATDMSNGTSPTPGMDDTARDLAKAFGLPWKGSGVVSKTANGFRYQMIYRSMVGGNHFNHVHFGVRKA